MTRAGHPCTDCGMPTSGTRCLACFNASRQHRPTLTSCRFCGINTRRTTRICTACQAAQNAEPADDDAYDGRIVRRGLISVFIPTPPPRIKPTCPGLTCWQCLDDLSPGLARRTTNGWRHANADQCVENLAAQRRQGTAA